MQWLPYLLVGFAALVLLNQFLAMGRARQMLGRPAPDTSTLDGEARSDQRRVYYFHARHCGHCRAMTPLVDRVGADHRNLIKVDVAQWPELARGFGITATPSFVVVEDGAIRQVRLGTQNEKQLQNLLLGERP